MKLYYTPGSCSVGCWIALEWAGVSFETEKADVKSEDFMRINPFGMVPALDIDEDRVLTQNSAILQYVADQFPESDLGADSGVEEQARFNEIMSFLTGDFHPSFGGVFHPSKYAKSDEQDDLNVVREAGYKSVDKVMNFLDGLIGDADHLYKNKKTVLDAYAFIMARWTVKTPKPWTEYPNVARFMEKMSQDEGVMKALKESGSVK